MMPLPRLAITVGDPAGIGPEIARAAAGDPRVRAVCEPVLYGPPEGASFEPGVLSAAACLAACDAIETAVRDAVAGRVAGLVTAPINKLAFAKAGLSWTGHTDLLAHLTGSRRVAMAFWSEPLVVVLATVHVPLAEVPRRLTTASLLDVIELCAAALADFPRRPGVPVRPRPRIVMAGLNPHAGEAGLLGDEEGRIIVPALEEARRRGVDIEGPLPGDTVFVRAARGEWDAVIACYHDQGLIPVKLLAFGRSVNVTLGLPIVRTSVDHGTAFDIAGRHVADPSSMIEAVRLAAHLAGRRAGRSSTSVVVP
jgi:4-phospho-D-threonate 3-dehydrogenase / 4-phospho-D-erythronate 3-dehydrogenase